MWPSTKVLFGTLTGLVLAVASAVMTDITVLDVIPERWRPLIVALASGIVAYSVNERNPSPSTIARVRELDALDNVVSGE